MNSSKTDPEFVDSIAQEVRFGPPQFVAHLAQPLQPEVALILNLRGQFTEPLQERARSAYVPIEDDSCLGHFDPSLFAILRNCNLPTFVDGSAETQLNSVRFYFTGFPVPSTSSM